MGKKLIGLFLSIIVLVSVIGFFLNYQVYKSYEGIVVKVGQDLDTSYVQVCFEDGFYINFNKQYLNSLIILRDNPHVILYYHGLVFATVQELDRIEYIIDR